MRDVTTGDYGETMVRLWREEYMGVLWDRRTLACTLWDNDTRSVWTVGRCDLVGACGTMGLRNVVELGIR